MMAIKSSIVETKADYSKRCRRFFSVSDAESISAVAATLIHCPLRRAFVIQILSFR